MFKLIPVIALITSALMLWLAAADIKHEWKKARWRLRHSLDVIALSIGFVCMFATSIYALLLG
jgi:general stress protein CsbA